MTGNNGSHSQKTIPSQGILYPLEWLGWVKDSTSLAEIKVLACVYGYDAIIGTESQHPTFSDLVQQTGMTERSVSDGIKRAIDRKILQSIDENGSRVFHPVAKSIAHVHDHVTIKDMFDLNSNIIHEHEHDAESIARNFFLKILLDEFGLSVTNRTQRIAHDICINPKYSLTRIENQIRYTRYEIANGENGEPTQPIRNPAGRLVYRIRANVPQPNGYSLIAALEAEGRSRSEVYEAVYNGEIDNPEISESVGYASWIALEKRGLA